MALSELSQHYLASGANPAFTPGTPEFAARMIEEEQANRQRNINLTIDNMMKTIVDSMPKPDPAKAPKLSDYYNEQLATETATKQYEPYYSELLSNYLTDQQTKKTRLQEDTARGLSSIAATTSETAQQRALGRQSTVLDYEQAIRQAEEGYAGRGLTYSGIKNRDMGNIQTKQNIGLQSYDIGTQSSLRNLGLQKSATELNLGRGTEDIATETARKQLETQRQQQQAISGDVATQRGEGLNLYGLAQQEYNKGYGYSNSDLASTLSNVLGQFRSLV